MNPPTILWADDDLDDLELFREAILTRHQNCQLFTFSNGLELLESLRSGNHIADPLLIILDINMPRLNGKETLQVLKGESRYAKIPVVLCSTSQNESDQDFCRRLRVPLITKPCTFRQVSEILQRILSYCQLDGGPTASFNQDV